MTRNLPGAIGAAALALMVALPVSAQTGQITGQVVDRNTRQPLVGAQVYVEGTAFGSLTQENGRYLILNVPPGTYTINVQLLGHANGRAENIRVLSGQVATVNFDLGITALKLEEVVVTGTADPIAGVKVPFTVGKVTKADMPVPAARAEASLQGKVAGVRVVKPTGQPGSGVDVLLRGATSINKDNEPLYVVDGVILAADLVDIDASDIESIEVVKGAAAASLYGSRASAGVVQITTSRGRDVTEGSTRIMLRSEYGFNQLNLRRDYITKHHHYRVSGGNWVNAAGQPVSKDLRVVDADLIADNPYPGPLYDHIDLFFNAGGYLRNNVSIAQNTRSTNFMASFNMQDDKGVVEGICDQATFGDWPIPDFCGNDGAQLYGVRVNLDHRLRDDLNFSVSSYYSRYHQEDFARDVFYDIMFMPPDVDLRAKNPDGQPFIIQPDAFTLQNNPLYAIAFATNEDFRSRYSGSGTVRYSPANWFSLETNVSFDRSDRNGDNWTPKGFKTGPNTTSTGSVSRSHNRTQALNGNITASFLRSFGDLTTRTKLQYALEKETNDSRSGAGNTLAVVGVNDIDVAINESAGSGFTDVRSAGYYAITGLDYQGKYIGEAMVRRDGSSLFGPDDRWHTYYRGSAAWRISEEPWWFIPTLNEFKLRYSIGTAGGRPEFSDRYEVWNVSSGVVSKGTLGNKLLRPEHQTEQEIGIDMIANNRHSLQLVYARSKVEDQLLQIPLPALFGYSTQWQNAGTIESTTYEATLETMLVQRPGLQWSVNLVADRTRSEITEFNRGCYGTTPYYCKGAQIGQIRGHRHLRSLGELPTVHANSQSQFQVNDDGYVVPVGAGNTYRDGVAKKLWGTKVTIDGVSYDWGIPIFQLNKAGIKDLVVIGDVNPDLNLGMSHNVVWKGFNFYGLMDAKVGGDTYNNTRQWAYRDNTHADYDQSAKPDELKKPITYYQILYNTNARTQYFIEKSTYLKLRELSVQYSFNRDQLQSLFGGIGVERLTLGLVGRNLFTWTDYLGFDPEVGSIRSSFDGFEYPNFRTFTMKVDVQF